MNIKEKRAHLWAWLRNKIPGPSPMKENLKEIRGSVEGALTLFEKNLIREACLIGEDAAGRLDALSQTNPGLLPEGNDLEESRSLFRSFVASPEGTPEDQVSSALFKFKALVDGALLWRNSPTKP